MVIPSINSKVFVQSIVYSDITSEIIYVFSNDGIESEYSGRLHDNLGIKGIEYSDELETFLMLLMPIDSRVSKKLHALSWDYVEGKILNFPVVLISP
ncbi:hypothetical protein [Pseudomonas marginalis]|jgi:hypothetical protein|uniref:hypothetical protein n=1 Tax=Pseudomonas marginalis TaxID=298 RepID=UPI001475F4E0|nr:hypothetical protein [Pseudomonas marginalis]NMZ90066.1 hypothetical protein [Pseudomonas marginalis]